MYLDIDDELVEDEPACPPEWADEFYDGHAAGEMLSDNALCFFEDNASHLSITHPVCRCGRAIQAQQGAGRPKTLCSRSCEGKHYRNRAARAKAAGMTLAENRRVVITTLGERGVDEPWDVASRGRWAGKVEQEMGYTPPVAAQRPNSTEAQDIGDLMESGHNINAVGDNARDIERTQDLRFFKASAGEQAGRWLQMADKLGRGPTDEEFEAAFGPIKNETSRSCAGSGFATRKLVSNDADYDDEWVDRDSPDPYADEGELYTISYD